MKGSKPATSTTTLVPQFDANISLIAVHMYFVDSQSNVSPLLPLMCIHVLLTTSSFSINFYYNIDSSFTI